jgi:deoxyribodipyrimidine photo-lyase
MLSKAQHQIETVTFEPTRLAGLERLEEFVSRTGAHYSSQRHYDFGSGDHSGVSALSAWIKHRLITEEEVYPRSILAQLFQRVDATAPKCLAQLSKQLGVDA